MPSRHTNERVLHHCWVRQYVRPKALSTTDGLAVEVLFPGRLTMDAGPDIRAARLRIGGTVYAGPIEIHSSAAEWYAHGHQHDTRYNDVILHVVFNPPPPAFETRTESGRAIPHLVLSAVLDRPIEDIRTDTMFDLLDEYRGAIPCSGINHRVPPSVLRSWIDKLTIERMEIKLRRMEDRLYELARLNQRRLHEPHGHWKDEGNWNPHDETPSPDPEISTLELTRKELWEQLMYEGCMEGLGYSKNRRPFMRLSESLPLDLFRSFQLDSVIIEAVLFGAAGLLPDATTVEDVEARTYVHMLHREWGRFNPLYRAPRLTAYDWTPTPSRPMNSPVLRLVAARSLIQHLIDDDLFRVCLHLIKHGETAGSTRDGLHAALRVHPGPFWERRVTFTRIVPRSVQPLGIARRDDLIVNTVIPLALLYSRIFRDTRLRSQVLRLLRGYPATQSNNVTRRMERQLIRQAFSVRTATAQQGLIQLYQYYCAEGRCGDCEVGRLVWGAASFQTDATGSADVLRSDPDPYDRPITPDPSQDPTFPGEG